MLAVEVTRRLIAVLIVVGLGFGVWALWPRGQSDTPTATTTVADPSTTTALVTTTTTPELMTTTTGATPEVVDTVEEAEQILRELWFGWFEGIYNEDEDRIREVVASQRDLDAARAQFGVMAFFAPPKRRSIRVRNTEILHSDPECLVAWTTLVISDFLEGESKAVNVLRFEDGRWKTFSQWTHKNDLWQTDCELLLEPLQ